MKFMPADLLQMSPAAGCGCKLPLEAQQKMMAAVDGMVGSLPANKRILVGASARDDAALFELQDGRLLVLTVDFGTPISSDPSIWGRVAALNALSDVYAIGGTPILALSTLGCRRYFI
jgi:selenide,water dikinase